MRTVLLTILVGFLSFLSGLAIVYAQDKTMFRKAQGFMPDVVRVTAKMPDEGRICIEVPGGLDACRTIRELRKWALTSALK
mgnify:CR=1 FL=1